MTEWIKDQPGVIGIEDYPEFQNEGIFVSDAFSSSYVGSGPGVFAFCREAQMLDRPAEPERILLDWGFDKDYDGWFVEKSPVHMIQHEYLKRCFPEAYHFCVVRHPFVVAAATRRWANPQMPNPLQHWFRAMEIWEDSTRGDPKAGIIRYESLPNLPSKFPIEMGPLENFENTNSEYFEKYKFSNAPVRYMDTMLKYGYIAEPPWHI